MPTTDLHQPSRQPHQQDREPDWREALARAIKRNSLDRERQIFLDWERQKTPQRHQPQG